ncbi:hypothetical protein [Owariibacterium komagatae]|uniref:hypothetical protein n=1 Tax=Owariibacterium komagatae TaxID=3136601 RepID=UPI0038B26B89
MYDTLQVGKNFHKSVFSFTGPCVRKDGILFHYTGFAQNDNIGLRCIRTGIKMKERKSPQKREKKALYDENNCGIV